MVVPVNNVQSTLTDPNTHACPPYEQQAVPPPTPNCPPRAFSYSEWSKNFSLFKCSSRKRILKKFSFLNYWKFLKVSSMCELLGKVGAPVHFSGGGNGTDVFCEQSLSITQCIALSHDWGSRSYFFQSWRVTAGFCASFSIEGWFEDISELWPPCW